MARISGVDIPSGKRIEIGLTYLYGVGKAKDLTDDQVLRIRDVLKEYLTEGDLRKEISQNIKRLKDINSYRGNRHRKNLPCRGQRTRTNARTKRGMRKTVGGKKQEEKRG